MKNTDNNEKIIPFPRPPKIKPEQDPLWPGDAVQLPGTIKGDDGEDTVIPLVR